MRGVLTGTEKLPIEQWRLIRRALDQLERVRMSKILPEDPERTPGVCGGIYRTDSRGQPSAAGPEAAGPARRPGKS